MIMADSFTDPAVERQGGEVRERDHRAYSMVPVEDRMRAYVEHEHARGRNLTLTLDVLLKAHESLISVGDRLKHGMAVTENVVIQYRAYCALGEWAEANSHEGYFKPLPPELRDFFDRALQEESAPLGSVDGGHPSSEGPTDAANDGPKPDVENLVGHFRKDDSCDSSTHNAP
jgi:hypothetical protein